MKKNNKLVSNLLFQTAYQILVIFLPFITTPYIARALGRINSGIYSYSYTIADYFVIFAMLGINSYGCREIAKAKDKSREELSIVFSGMLEIHILLSILSVLVYGIYVLLFVRDYKQIFLIQTLWVFSALFDINWFFFGVEEFRITVIRNTIVKMVTIILIFTLVKSEQDLMLYTLIMSASTVFSNLLVWAFLPQYASFVWVPFGKACKHLKPMAILFVAVIATSLYRMIDKVMLGQMSTMSELGCYEYADKIIRIPVALITAVGNVMLPRISVLVEKKDAQAAERYLDMSSQLILALTVAIAFGIAGIAEEFVVLFLGDAYSDTTVFVKILAISIPFMGWNNLIRTQVLMPNTLDKIYTWAVWSGAILNVIMNYLLIPLIGASGAAVATVLCYFVVGCGQTLPIIKRFHLYKYIVNGAVPVLCGILMYSTVRFVGRLLGGSILGVCTEILVGAFVFACSYLVYLRITRNWLYLYITTSIRRAVGRKK